MSKQIYLQFFLFFVFSTAFAQKSTSDSTKTIKTEAQKGVSVNATASNPIRWVSLSDADKCMHDSTNTKKVYVFFYTDWCAFCHEMEAKTFQNQELADYLNQHFLCVKFNTELLDTVSFKGKNYGAARQNGWDCNGFAKAYLGEKLAFPSNLLLDATGEKMAALGGFQTYFRLMTFVTYFNECFYKTIDLETYGTGFKMPSWNGKGGRSGTVRRLPIPKEEVKK